MMCGQWTEYDSGRAETTLPPTAGAAARWAKLRPNPSLRLDYLH